MFNYEPTVLKINLFTFSLLNNKQKVNNLKYK